MDIDEKQILLSEHLNEFRSWSYQQLASEIQRTQQQHESLRRFEGVFADGTEYQLVFDVFWDDKRGGDVRVCGDLTTRPQPPFVATPVVTPDVTDSFIMRADGTFVGE